MSFDELEKALKDINKYTRYEELINYIVEKRKNDQSYKELIKSKIIEIVDEYCEGKERKDDLISSKEILESSNEYENAARLKSLANNDDFMDEVVDAYIKKTSTEIKVGSDLSTKCKNDLLGVSFESELLLESFDDKYIGNPDILKRVWKYLNTEVLVDGSSTLAMNEINQLHLSCMQLNMVLNTSDEEFYVLGCELLKKFYSEEIKRLLVDNDNNLNTDIERLRINNKCLKDLLHNKGISDKNASFIFNIIEDKLLAARDYIHFLVNDEEYDINLIENNTYLLNNIFYIKKIIENVFNDKTEQIIKLTNKHNELNKAGKLTLVKNYNLFSQSIYVMYMLQLIEKKPKVILNFNENEKLEEYIVNKLVNMDTLKDIYNDILSKYLNMNFDYSSLIQIPDYCFTPTSGKDLLQYLMYIPGNDSINSLTYDENQKILVDAIFKIIYYEMAKKYTEDKIELGRKNYIELLQRKMNKLDIYYNLSGFGDYQYKYYCGIRRKEIEDEIQRIKSKDTSGFISLILGKYICDVYENTDAIKELGKEINQIKTTFMDLCKEVLADIAFDNDRFVVDKNGVTIYNIDVIKNALEEIVTKGGYGTSLEKVKQTVKLQYEINYYTYASKSENIIFCIWNKIFANFSTKLLEKMTEVKSEIINSKISANGLVYFVNKDDYEEINKILEEDLKQNKRFASKKKLEREKEIQADVQYIINALKLQQDYKYKFSAEKYNEIASDKNYFRFSDLIEEMLKDDEFDLNVDNIYYCLFNTNECEFNIVNDRIIRLSREIENKIAVLSNKISSSPRKASDLEMDKFKELCDKLGKSIDETIRLLSNENNFVMLLGLVAGYDDTLIEMKKGIISFEQVFDINPEVSYNLKNNLLTDLTTLLVGEKNRIKPGIKTSLKTTDNSSTEDDLGPKLSYRLK